MGAGDNTERNGKSGQQGDELRVSFLTPAELEERYGSSGDPRARWLENRRRNRAAGVDRFGRPLKRALGTNPRALGTNPRAQRGVEHVEKRKGVQR
jgi:hypothetical protein